VGRQALPEQWSNLSGEAFNISVWINGTTSLREFFCRSRNNWLIRVKFAVMLHRQGSSPLDGFRAHWAARAGNAKDDFVSWTEIDQLPSTLATAVRSAACNSEFD
jgi:hypothetical protein